MRGKKGGSWGGRGNGVVNEVDEGGRGLWVIVEYRVQGRS